MAANQLKKLMLNQAYGLVFQQLTGVFLLTVLALLVFSTKDALSILAGGLAYGLPNLFFVWRVFKFTRAKEMNQFVSAFFIFEMFKLILSGICFLLVVKYLPVSLLSVLIGFVGAIVSFWIASVCRFGKNSPVKQVG